MQFPPPFLPRPPMVAAVPPIFHYGAPATYVASGVPPTLLPFPVPFGTVPRAVIEGGQRQRAGPFYNKQKQLCEKEERQSFDALAEYEKFERTRKKAPAGQGQGRPRSPSSSSRSTSCSSDSASSYTRSSYSRSYSRSRRRSRSARRRRGPRRRSRSPRSRSPRRRHSPRRSRSSRSPPPRPRRAALSSSAVRHQRALPNDFLYHMQQQQPHTPLVYQQPPPMMMMPGMPPLPMIGMPPCPFFGAPPMVFLHQFAPQFAQQWDPRFGGGFRGGAPGGGQFGAARPPFRSGGGGAGGSFRPSFQASGLSRGGSSQFPGGRLEREDFALRKGPRTPSTPRSRSPSSGDDRLAMDASKLMRERSRKEETPRKRSAKPSEESVRVRKEKKDKRMAVSFVLEVFSDQGEPLREIINDPSPDDFTSYKLCQTIRELVPGTDLTKLTWEDADGKHFRLRCDEDLKTALMCLHRMKDGSEALKIHVIFLQSHGPGESSTSAGAGPKPLGQSVSAIDSHVHQIESSTKSISQCNAVNRVPSAIKPCKMPKKRKLSCPINDLADEVLLRILKLLPPGERLSASEVCKRWNGLSRIQWHDVTHLELTVEIPENSTRPIIALCPNLQAVVAHGKWFAVNELQILTRMNLSSVKLYDCTADIPEPEYDDDFDVFSGVFSNDLAHASCEELVLHDLCVVVQNDDFRGHASLSSLPASLKRLQLSGINVTDPQLESVDLNGPPRFLRDIGHLQNLTCLILSSTCSSILLDYILSEEGYFLRELQTLKSLRELFLGFLDTPVFTVGFLFNLPSLAVLFLHNIELEVEEEEEFGRLVTKHPSLRILAITGPFTHEHFVPARRLYPSGFGSTPVPKLHVFVGKEPSEKILFTKSSEEALKIHPITEPLSSFLVKPEITPIFEDVWIAAQIKESDEHRQELFCDGVDAATSFRVTDDT